MRRFPPGVTPSVDGRDLGDEVQQLAAQLRIADIALQDLDFDVALGQILQTICGLHHVQTGVLLLYHNGAETAGAPGTKDVAILDGLALHELARDLRLSYSHAIVLWRGWVYDLLRVRRELSIPTMLEEIVEEDRFVAAPLVVSSRHLGRIVVGFPGGAGLAELDSQRFSELADEAARAIDRARMLDQAKVRHREAEGLYQTVHEISTYLELDEVLRAIVRRARDLLGTDVAYLMLNQTDRDEIYMRVTEGINTTEFKSTTMKLGEGLGGLVAKIREAAFTPNYLADPRFQHVGHIDEAVTKERIVGILGVPLIVADRVIGVLFAANRRPTHFGPDNVKLLSSLANSAAVAIEKAWLYAKEREAVRKLQELNELITVQAEMLRKSMHVHEQLAALLLSGQGMEQIARALANLVGNPVIVEDHQFRPIAQALPSSSPTTDIEMSTSMPQSPELSEIIKMLAENRHAVRLPSSGSALQVPRVIAPMIIGQDLVGYVSIVESNRVVEELDYIILEQAAVILSLEMAKQKAALEAELRLRGDFLDEILCGKHENERAILSRAPRFGYDLTKPHQVMVFALDPTRQSGERLGAGGADVVPRRRLMFEKVKDVMARRVPGAVVASREDVVVVLLPAGSGHNPEDAKSLAESAVAEVNNLAVALSISAGLGRVCCKLADYATSFREATDCLTILRQLGRAGQALCSDQLGVLRLLRVDDRDELSAFVNRTLGELQRYDKRHSASLVETIRTYLDNNRNLQSTAKLLHIHANTLLYRLQRVRDISQSDLDDAETCLNLHIALKILQLVG